jgi:hypothetical protein
LLNSRVTNHQAIVGHSGAADGVDDATRDGTVNLTGHSRLREHEFHQGESIARSGGKPKGQDGLAIHGAMVDRTGAQTDRGHATGTVLDAQTLRAAPAVGKNRLHDGGEVPKPHVGASVPPVLGHRSRTEGDITTVRRVNLPSEIKDDNAPPVRQP